VSKRKFAFVALVAVATLFSLATSHAQEGGPQIGRAVNEISRSIRSGAIIQLPRIVRDCYQALGAAAGSDKVAYCFGLDYAACQLRQLTAADFDAEGQRYLSIEKVLTRVNRALDARKVEQAERGPLIAFWTNSTRSMLRKAGSLRQQSQSSTGSKIEAAKTAALKLVRDPTQARVTDLQWTITPNVRGEPTEVVCGKISERSGAGGNMRARPFVYFVSEQSANYDNGSDDIDREIVKNFCQLP
jgi:hypothetical protein